MSDFEVLHRGRVSPEPFSGYLYEIRRADEKVAELTHNHRGEEYCIRAGSFGSWEPFENILEGGGPQPLRVTSAGAALLSDYLSKHRPY
jgi:hypothetical protein